jgi:L-2-hydroxyglutarate oxidase LhgO
MAVKGTEAMKEYCEENGVEVRNCGKLVIPTTEAEHEIVE